MLENITVHVAGSADRKFLRMYYDCPVSGKRVWRSTGTRDWTEAHRKAAQWELDLREGRYSKSPAMLWSEFRDLYEEEKLPSLAVATQKAAMTAMNHLERVIDPLRLRSLTSAVFSQFVARLRGQGMKETTIACHLRHVGAALAWAVQVELLAKVPNLHKPKRVKGGKLMRGRPVTAEEFDRMLAAVPKVRNRDPGLWQQYLTGLWLSGLRLEESLRLSWDPEGDFTVDLSGQHPRFRIYAEAEKGFKDRLLPMTPDFAGWLLQTPEDFREGRVFKIEGLYTGQPMTPKRVSRIVSAIGRTAGVIVNKADGKCATAHDLRRSFGTRWAARVRPATLQLLMRHASIETTLRYYVALDADELAAELWEGWNPDQVSTWVSTWPDSAKKDRKAPDDETPEAL